MDDQSINDFVMPLLRAALKLRQARDAGTGCTLEADEAKAVVEALCR